MDENTWRLAQVVMWLIGCQTVIIGTALGIIWAKICKMDDKITHIDKDVFGIKTMIHMQDCCMLKDDRQNKKMAE